MAAAPSPFSSPAVAGIAQTAASLPPTVELLAYYRKRIEEFEAERAEFLKRFRTVEETSDEVHKLRYEVKVREQEVVELQKALSDANVFLFDEREQILKLQAENDALKIQEIEDRRRIQHLLALTQPVAQEVTFFRDCRPEKMTRYPAATAEASSGSGTPKDGSAVSHRKLGDDSSPAQNRVLRTVYLPSERADALLLTTQSLQQQLDDMRKLMDERTEAWRKDRQEREQAHKRKQDADAAKIAALGADVEKTKDKLRAVTEDYLGLRHESQATTRQLQETSAALQAANAKLLQELVNTRSMADQEVEHVKQAAKREGVHFKEYTRQQAQQREDDLRLLKEQYAEVQRLYEARVKLLEDKLQKLKAKYTTLYRRRNLELEGFTNDISSMRRTMAQFESQWAVLSESLAMHSSGSTSMSSPTTPKQLRAPGHLSRSKLSDADASALLQWRVKSSGYGDGGEGVPSRRPKSSSRRMRRRTPEKKVVNWPPAQHTHAGHTTTDDSGEEREAPSRRHVTPSKSADLSTLQHSLMAEKLRAELDRAVNEMTALRDKVSDASRVVE